jgi:hypothetical protein
MQSEKEAFWPLSSMMLLSMSERDLLKSAERDFLVGMGVSHALYFIQEQRNRQNDCGEQGRYSIGPMKSHQGRWPAAKSVTLQSKLTLKKG